MDTSTRVKGKINYRSLAGRARLFMIVAIVVAGFAFSFGFAKCQFIGRASVTAVMGQVLQILGTITVILKLWVRLKQYAGGAATKNILKLFKDFPAFVPIEPRNVDFDFRISFDAVDTGTSHESATVLKHNTTENDVAVLSAALRALEEKLNAFVSLDASEKGGIISRINQQTSTLNRELKQMEVDLELKEREGFGWEIIGALWLIFGLIISLYSLYEF